MIDDNQEKRAFDLGQRHGQFLKEIGEIALGVVMVLSVFAALIAATCGIVWYLNGDPPHQLWKLAAGIVVWICFGTFWVYMRTHHWAD